MPKIVLGNRPESFKHAIKVPLPGGEEGLITMTYRYRTRKEFGEFLDGLFKAAEMQPASIDAAEVEFSMARALSKVSDTNADYILQVAIGWNLDSDFSRPNVEQLCNELPGVAMAIINTYRQAVQEGRLGN